MEILVKKAGLNDLNNLAVLKQQVWISTYATEGIIEEFSKYVLSEYSVENIKKSITDKTKLTLIAVDNKSVIGCVEILLTPTKPINTIEPSIEISNFYILEKFQGGGIGKKLLTACLKEIKQLSFNKVWLTVYYKNQNAIEFYLKQHFSQIGETEFILENNKHKNYIMLRNI